ncbi:hypothetical protein GRZ55_22730 [Chelativorans sp. ZYF759]|uniref:hypothetical protein n=1 Tax=Chelativorans sp. ZYF759 TaxID=2692213 RepID=UPI00145E3630|nr:hypothetical protein [Chelativorans sp. ZYF759]NMG42040.1 hypothetical protein [Chelativorans sp. ZYF759]
MKGKLALIGLVFAMAMPAQTFAATKTYTVTPNRDNCYAVEYIPRTVQENTRGQLVRGESTAWVGNVTDGNLVRHQRNPALYKTTTRIVEEEHYTMRSAPCPARSR